MCIFAVVILLGDVNITNASVNIIVWVFINSLWLNEFYSYFETLMMSQLHCILYASSPSTHLLEPPLGDRPHHLATLCPALPPFATNNPLSLPPLIPCSLVDAPLPKP
ncbi:hypothetical protein VNO78_11857 [Psophocarpus tetragonolobus]|uniref:Uncharacterized protein n=1 Tax=Psophocarpus tetragonolobus TaxID=3891 RepID=A0AAN9XP35_PSOTE